jgi:quercetin dioxygenase-like cupin family protein
VKRNEDFPLSSSQAKEAEGGASKTRVRWLITEEIGAYNFAMRLFEMAPDGSSPLHTHPWEHEVFILNGEGKLFDDKKALPFKAGDVVFVLPDERHQFKNIRQEAPEISLPHTLHGKMKPARSLRFQLKIYPSCYM